MKKRGGVHGVGRVSSPPCRVFYPAHPTQDGPPFRSHAQPMADVPGRIPGTAGEKPALPKKRIPPSEPLCGEDGTKKGRGEEWAGSRRPITTAASPAPI